MPEADGDYTISAKIVYDKQVVQEKYGDIDEDKIKDIIWQEVKKINKTIPTYQYVKKIIVTDEELVKTTTQKTKRQVEMEKILQK